MINRKQFKASFYLALLFSLIRLFLALITSGTTVKENFQALTLFFYTNVWFVPIILLLGYILVVTCSIYLIFRVLNYIINFLRKIN